MADWAEVTRSWVTDGLIREDQRGPLLGRLEALPAPEGGSGAGLPIGPIVTALVAGAVWLLTGALVAALALGLDLDDRAMGMLLAGAGGVSFGVGALMRLAPPLRSPARGLLAASTPLVTVGLFALVDPPRGFVAPVFFLLPPALGAVAAGVEGSRAWAATATLTLMVWGWWALGTGGRMVEEALSLVFTAAVLGGAAVVARLLPVRSQTLQVMLPSAVLFVAIGVWLTDEHFSPVWRTIGLTFPFRTEKWLELLVFGVYATGVGVVTRTAGALVPSLLVVGVTAVGLTGELSGWIGAAIVLALGGGVFLAGATGLWGYRLVSDRARARAATPG